MRYIVTKIQKAKEIVQNTISEDEMIDMNITVPDETADLKTLDSAVVQASGILGAAQSYSILCLFMLGKRLDEIFHEVDAPNDKERFKITRRRYERAIGVSNSHQVSTRIQRARKIFNVLNGLTRCEILAIRDLYPSILYDLKIDFTTKVNQMIHNTMSC